MQTDRSSHALAARRDPPGGAAPLAFSVVSLIVCALAIGVARSALAESFIWVDPQGITRITDDPEAVPESVRERSSDWEHTRDLWEDGGFLGVPTGTPAGASGSERDRLTRLVRGAVHDLQRGESARAAATLHSILEVDPMRPEAHWYLALLDRQRGRYESSEGHLRKFLQAAGDELGPLRESAEKRLRALADERRLADEASAQGEFQLVARESPNFTIRVDAELDAIGGETGSASHPTKAASGYTATALRFLEDARAEVSRKLGVTPEEPLGVVFYGRARYDQQHRHRFSFATVGFFDGRIHVASPAHPAGELRSLLFHEYTHALYREQTGGDRPYWLNEGLAEKIERSSRRQGASTHSERAALRARIDAGTWIPLQSLAESFSGLSNADARIAYLEAVMAADWIERRTSRDQRAQLLKRLGSGFSIDQALYESVGLDTLGVEQALREEIRSEFPELVDLQ